MGAKSRTEYSVMNASAGFAARSISMIISFFTRMVFTRTVSESIVGINALFGDILSILALSELGIGTALGYALYKPIAEGNIPRQMALLRVYRTLYRVIAGVIMVLGLGFLPFMSLLMKDLPEVDNLSLIFFLYLADSSISYLLAYKRALIEKNQKNYILLRYNILFQVIQAVAQIIVLLVTGNFTAFLVIRIICTISNNLCVSRKAVRMFPYIKERSRVRLDETDRKDLIRNIRAIILHKLGGVVVNHTDTLTISAFVGIVSVGAFSNYVLLLGKIRSLLSSFLQGVSASVGHLGATEKPETIGKVLEQTLFVAQWLYGMSAICIYETIDPFVELFFGGRFLLDRPVVLALCAEFFMIGMQGPVSIFWSSLGMFHKDRYVPLTESILNIVISVLLVQNMGITGVIIGTMASMLLTSFWVSPYLFYRQYLKKNPMRYFFLYIRYLAVICLAGVLVDLLCGRIRGTLPGILILRGLAAMTVSNLLLFLIYYRKKEFQDVKKRMIMLLQKMIKQTE